MRILLALLCFALISCASPPPKTHQVEKPRFLPLALDKDFEFRKVKQFFLDPASKQVGQIDASVAFERGYRMFGAITGVDQHQRYGNYYDFFWRAQRQADVRVRLEYKQEKLHALIQAREISYPQARGHYHTQFAIIGDDYFDDGRVTAWRATLIVNGRIVAVKRSYLWE